jgi:hypothetical protein
MISFGLGFIVTLIGREILVEPREQRFGGSLAVLVGEAVAGAFNDD